MIKHIIDKLHELFSNAEIEYTELPVSQEETAVASNGTASKKKPPCPLKVLLQNGCICVRCDKWSMCAIESKARLAGCEDGTIAACSQYVCEEDIDAEKKREVFRGGRVYIEDIFVTGKCTKNDRGTKEDSKD